MSMNQTELFNTVKAIIAEETGEDAAEITMATDFENDLHADSLDVFEVINEIEDRFDIKIETEEGLKTVGDLVNFVANKLGE